MHEAQDTYGAHQEGRELDGTRARAARIGSLATRIFRTVMKA